MVSCGCSCCLRRFCLDWPLEVGKMSSYNRIPWEWINEQDVFLWLLHCCWSNNIKVLSANFFAFLWAGPRPRPFIVDDEFGTKTLLLINAIRSVYGQSIFTRSSFIRWWSGERFIKLIRLRPGDGTLVYNWKLHQPSMSRIWTVWCRSHWLGKIRRICEEPPPFDLG